MLQEKKIKKHSHFTFIDFLHNVLHGKTKMLLLLICFQLISGICPVATSYLVAKLIDSISIIQNNSFHDNNLFSMNNIIILILGCAILLLCDEAFTVMHNFFSNYFEDIISHRTKYLLLKKISFHHNSEIFENPTINNLISISKKSLEETSRYVNLASHFMKSLFLLIPSLIAVFILEWWIPIILLISLTPLMYFKINLHKKVWEARFGSASLFKKMDIYEECLTSKNYSKEVKLYNMQARLLHLWQSLFLNFFMEINKVRKRGILIILLIAAVSCIGFIICFLYVAKNAITGKFSLGDLSFIFAIILQLRNSISGLIYSGGEIIKANLVIIPLLEILNIKSPDLSDIPLPKSSKTQNIIDIQNMTFAYSKGGEDAINNISLSIKTGETLAIVGENGSGKSTLIKLLCRFYEPLKGEILWKGVGINTIDFKEYRTKISCLFQDFAKFPLSVRENIDVRGLSLSDKQIYQSMEQLNLKLFFQNKLDNILSKALENGTELSGGQWQCLALARLLTDLQNNQSIELLIFDEPTSALDPHTEHNVIKLMKTMIKQKTSIVISHRLALTRFVERILVMEKGSIIEEGSHVELMKLKGKYYEMFTKQASYYQ